MINKIVNRQIVIYSILILMTSFSKGCTGIRLKAKDGSIIYARTLEFRQELDSKILFIPRNYKFQGATASKNKKGLSWKSHYAVVGANALNVTAIVDGVNEKGLAGGIFYFPDYAFYQKATPENSSQSLASWQLLTWILTTCSTIQEVKEKIHALTVTAVPINGAIQPLHYIIHDQEGSSLVIEYTKDKLNLYDNALGVITNSPSFDWHTTNLRNYVNLSALNVPKIKLSTITLTPFGQGSGMLGLPGDFTPPSRFIRAVAFSQSVIVGKNGQEALDAAFHVLNLFNIPLGVVRSTATEYDYTQWTSATNLKTQEYYFHTYNNRQLFKVSLSDLKNNKESITIPMSYKPSVIDLTPHKSCKTQ